MVATSVLFWGLKVLIHIYKMFRTVPGILKYLISVSYYLNCFTCLCPVHHSSLNSSVNSSIPSLLSKVVLSQSPTILLVFYCPCGI